MNNKIVEKIRNKTAVVAVVGLGYVGLPTAVTFATLGFKVNGLDINEKIIEGINNNTLETQEPGLKEKLVAARQGGLISATNSPTIALSSADVVIVCVQTPVDKQGNANLSFLEKACGQIGSNLKKQSLVVIQSTVPPGTLKEIVVPTIEKLSGLKCGVDFWLVYCPERMSPGTGLDDLKSNSRAIGAYNLESAALGVELFKHVTKGRLLVTNLDSAEISKLAENTFRFVNIAFSNELALLCRELGVDVQEVIKLANTHPRVNIHQPGCGAGGPCLSKDTHLLLRSAEKRGFKANIIPAAVRLNSAMGYYIVNFAEEGLRKCGKNISGSKIAVLGTAYKGGVDDPRDSPSEAIIRELERRHAKIVVYDPFCAENFGQCKVDNLLEAVTGADCIIIATDHKEFADLDLDKISSLMNKNPIILDGKRMIDPCTAKDKGFEYLAISGVLCSHDDIRTLRSSI